MKVLFKFKYPKLAILTATIILSYIIFSNDSFSSLISNQGNLGYIGIYFAGLCFSFGFTTAFGIGYFLTAEPNSLVIATLIGGLGALTGDLVIFKIIKSTFMDEFDRYKKSRSFKFIIHEINTLLNKKIKTYLLYAVAGLVIASPFPDEIGVSMLAGLTTIKPLKLSVISFVMNSVGILIMLLL